MVRAGLCYNHDYDSDFEQCHINDTTSVTTTFYWRNIQNYSLRVLVMVDGATNILLWMRHVVALAMPMFIMS